jgi:hypothetical protein
MSRLVPCLASVCLIALTAATPQVLLAAEGKGPAPSWQRLATLVGGPALVLPPMGRRDIHKDVIESPTKLVVRDALAAVAAPIAAEENPRVKPGEVKWHANLQAACDAAKKSNKPVLLFHMMGQLDRQFC